MRTRAEIEDAIVHAVLVLGGFAANKPGGTLAQIPVHGGLLDVVVRWSETTCPKNKGPTGADPSSEEAIGPVRVSGSNHTECGWPMPLGLSPYANPRNCARPEGHDGPHRSEGQVDGPYRGQLEELDEEDD